jgi:hypothetical protein
VAAAVENSLKRVGPVADGRPVPRQRDIRAQFEEYSSDVVAVIDLFGQAGKLSRGGDYVRK